MSPVSLVTDHHVEKCCICLEPFEKEKNCVVSACSHKFHDSCIGVWLIPSENRQCPLCRRDLNDDVKVMRKKIPITDSLKDMFVKFVNDYATLQLQAEQLICDRVDYEELYQQRPLNMVAPEEMQEESDSDSSAADEGAFAEELRRSGFRCSLGATKNQSRVILDRIGRVCQNPNLSYQISSLKKLWSSLQTCCDSMKNLIHEWLNNDESSDSLSESSE